MTLPQAKPPLAQAKPPLATVGVLSAASYAYRRAAARETWAQPRELDRANVLATFVIASANGTLPRASGDVVWLPTHGASMRRLISPLVTTFAWLQYATSSPPHSRASFVVKCDDDVYLHMPGLAAQLRMMLADSQRPSGPGLAHSALPLSSSIYFGRLYWTNYDAESYIHVATGYSPDHAGRAEKARLCENCTGPFPFATGSLQGLSLPLARALANSPAANLHVHEAIRRFSSSTRKTPVFEDAWLGYAMVGLLPPDPLRRMSVVAVDPMFVFDDSRFVMHNLTLLVHWKSGKQYARTFAARMRAAHDHASRYFCSESTPLLACGQWSHVTKWGAQYPSRLTGRGLPGGGRASCRRCVPEAHPWTVCSILPGMKSLPRDSPAWQLCPGFASYSFGLTGELLRKWTSTNETFAPSCTEADCVS